MRSRSRDLDTPTVAHAVPPTPSTARRSVRPPTLDEREAVAAWLEHQARVQQRGADILRALLAVVIGVLGAVALVHWLTPCAEGALCAWLALRWPREGKGAGMDVDDSISAYGRLAYVQGWRWGWLCGAVAGLLLGMLAMFAALELGRLVGAAAAAGAGA